MVADILKTLYTDTMDVYSMTHTQDADTGIDSNVETESYAGVPCRISFETTQATSKEDAPLVSQTVRIFCAPSILILAGSKLVVTRNGVTSTYKCSSKPAIYDSHIEILAEPVEEYA